MCIRDRSMPTPCASRPQAGTRCNPARSGGLRSCDAQRGTQVALTSRSTGHAQHYTSEALPALALPACLSLIHISEPTRLLSISYAVFCLKKKKNTTIQSY
eukprot:TRINITY_DN27666_c0_g1_i1.p1 TRINITY_DN27666_c0_g1~~TRINITY_DN27666_c0_g1_i1.p1  ORF type:complete len:101 (-),score=15.87 TRINITY_DN27666_c0_g1_i1:112-414(-)